MIVWVTRNRDGVVVIYGDKPYKNDFGDWSSAYDEQIVLLDRDLPEGVNPKWEDEEPIEVELTIKKIWKQKN